MPKICVVLPVYNGQKYIKEAIESIINQTYKDFELWIIDDGSTDKTQEIVESFKDSRIKGIILEQNNGNYFARNLALMESNSLYIAYQDADDISQPNRLQILLRTLMDSKSDVVYSSLDRIDEFGNRLDIKKAITNSENIYPTMLLRNCIYQPSSMISVQSIRDKNIYYHDSQKSVSDYQFWFNCLENNLNILGVNQPLIKYRIHKNQLSSQNKEERLAIISDIQSNAWIKLGMNPSNEMIELSSYFNTNNYDLNNPLKVDKILKLIKEMSICYSVAHPWTKQYFQSILNYQLLRLIIKSHFQVNVIKKVFKDFPNLYYKFPSAFLNGRLP